MKCPKFHAAILAYDPEFVGNQDDCLKEKCAWWDEQLECCTLVSLRVALKALFDVLTAISRKMPHEEQ